MRKFFLAVALALLFVIPGETQTVTTRGGTTVSSSAEGMAWRFDDFTATGDGIKVNVSTAGRKWFGIQVSGVGAAATAWTVKLQTSLDGVKYVDVLTHSSATGDSDGDIIWISTPAPSLYFRSSVSTLTLGSATKITVTIIGMN